jgi:CRISPR/Cas system-associated exonuclease Cas4 (RecB family)
VRQVNEEGTMPARRKNLFDPKSVEPYRISRSGISEWLACPRTFWLHRRLGIRPPSSPPMTINRALDSLLKREFDGYRKRREPHPAFLKHGLGAVPIDHPDIATWQSNFKGIAYLHQPTGLLVSGAPDDVMVVGGEWAVLDFKGTSSKQEIVALDTVYRQENGRQVEVYSWLLKMRGHPVGRKAYLLYANARSGGDALDGRLDFDLQLVEHLTNVEWIEPTLANIKACLLGEVPKPSRDCELCRYTKAVGDAIGRDAA